MKHTTIKYDPILGAMTVTKNMPDNTIRFKQNQETTTQVNKSNVVKKSSKQQLRILKQLRILNNKNKETTMTEVQQEKATAKKTTLDTLPKNFGKDAKKHSPKFKQHMKRVYSKSRTLFIKKATATKQLLQSLSQNDYQR